jgi:Skp family chaperone for outer membrane proteins
MMKTFATISIAVILSSTISIGISYYLAYRMPVAPQVAIADSSVIAKEFQNKNPGDPKVQFEFNMRVEELKKQAEKQAAMGVIVIDAGNVVAAPKEAYLHNAAGEKQNDK